MMYSLLTRCDFKKSLLLTGRFSLPKISDISITEAIKRDFKPQKPAFVEKRPGIDINQSFCNTILNLS